MENQFEAYARNLDKEIEKLPTLREFLKARDESKDTKIYFNGFVTNLKGILESLGASNVRDHEWHQYVSSVRFGLTSSPYFSLGLFGSCEDVIANENLDGVIAVGFDEDLDYEPEHKPDLVLFYIDEKTNTDIDLHTPEEWRNVLSEFFDISKVIKTK
jgi:hypothetical protein